MVHPSERDGLILWSKREVAFPGRHTWDEGREHIAGDARAVVIAE